jgi:hypothetical protein
MEFDRRIGNDRFSQMTTEHFLFVAGDLGSNTTFKRLIHWLLDIRPELYFNSDDFRNDNFGPDCFKYGYRF